MTLVRLAAVLTSLTFIWATLLLMLWGFLRLVRIIRRKLTPMVWACFGGLATLNACFDCGYSLWAGFGFDLVALVFASVMLSRARPARVMP